VNPEIAPELERIIGKALENDRNLRYQSAAELRADIARLKRDTESGRVTAAQTHTEATPRPWSRRQRFLWGAVCLVLATLLGIAAWSRRPVSSTASLPVSRIAISLPPGQFMTRPSTGPSVAISPDGTRLA
jgi:hypothetical protein